MKRCTQILGVVLAVVLLAGITVPTHSGAEAAPSDEAARKPKRDAYFTDPIAGAVYRTQIKFTSKPKVKVKKTFNKVKEPWGAAVDPAKKFLLVTDHARDELVKLNAKKGKVISTVAVGKNPTDVAIHPSGDFAYVVNNGDDTVSIVDTRTDQVVETHNTGKGPLRIQVSNNGNRAWVTNTTDNTLTAFEFGSAVKGNSRSDTVVYTKQSVSCDVSGGIGSAYFRIPGNSFHFINFSCGTSAVADAFPGRARGDGDDANETETSSKSPSSNAPPPSGRAGRTLRVNQHDMYFRKAAGFNVPGAPAELATSGMTRSPAYVSGNTCTANVLAAGFGPQLTLDDLGDDQTWLWKFGEIAVPIADGSPFEPLIGGGGDSIFAYPICGNGCTGASVPARTREVAIKGAQGIQDGSMIPVPFGDDC